MKLGSEEPKLIFQERFVQTKLHWHKNIKKGLLTQPEWKKIYLEDAKVWEYFFVLTDPIAIFVLIRV